MSEIVRQVADDIYQVQLPLPFELSIVNCYLLQDRDGWTIIDTGINYPSGREVWQRAFAELGIKISAIRRIVLTHAHPDHYGMAGWLQQQSGAPVFLSPIEQDFANAVWRDGLYSDPQFAAFFQKYGMPADLAAQVVRDMAALRTLTAPHPETTRIEPDTTLSISGRSFRTLLTPGHSEGHLAFYCADERLLLSGDVVLRKITPNIGLWPLSGPNPLAAFLRSLDYLRELPVKLALPGHGPLIDHFEERIAEIQAHHEQRLQTVEKSIHDGATAYAVCTSIFPVARLSSHQMRFALAEALAHLEYLVQAGRLRRVEADEVMYFCS